MLAALQIRGASVRSLQILVVDDDDADALMISEALETAEPRATVRRVVDGQEALDYLRRKGRFSDAHRPDLILLDLNMPRMDGRETLAAIKTDETLKAIPVVILTTSSATPDIVASYQHRANLYVTKPFGLEDFESTVRQIDRFYREVAVLPEADCSRPAVYADCAWGTSARMADNKNEAPEDLGLPVSYMVLADGTPVWDRAGDRVGTVEHVLADDQEDVFHGLIIKTHDGHRYASSDQVDGIFERGVIVAVPAAQLAEPSADGPAQVVDNDRLKNELKRAWEWLIQPRS
jgi:CheY-like chemotaxis protein